MSVKFPSRPPASTDDCLLVRVQIEGHGHELRAEAFGEEDELADIERVILLVIFAKFVNGANKGRRTALNHGW